MKNTKIVSTMALASILLAGCGAKQGTGNPTPGTWNNTNRQKTLPTAIVTTSDKVTTTGVKSYNAVGSYMTPEGNEQIGIELGIKDGVVINGKATVMARDKQSTRFQQDFADNFAPAVVGKKLSDLAATKISGGSLTPQGFRDALEKIKQQAGV